MEVEGEERDLLKSASKFRIDSKTGVISIVGDIDREANRANRVVTMIVEDIIDNSPEFVTVPTGLLGLSYSSAGQ